MSFPHRSPAPAQHHTNVGGSWDSVFIGDELELLRQAISLLERVSRGSLVTRGDNELCELTTVAETAGRLIDSVRVQAAGEIDERSRFEPGGMRSTATVMAVVRLEDLESGRGVCWLDDVVEPLSMASIRELVCDAGHRKVLLGNAGEILYVGRLQRLFTAAQRYALAVRDGGCVWPNCQAPPG